MTCRVFTRQNVRRKQINIAFTSASHFCLEHRATSFVDPDLNPLFPRRIPQINWDRLHLSQVEWMRLIVGDGLHPSIKLKNRGFGPPSRPKALTRLSGPRPNEKISLRLLCSASRKRMSARLESPIALPDREHVR